MNFKLNVKYTLSQVLYCASICVGLGYASLYLLSKGFSNSLIGITMSFGSIISVILQPILASYADKSSYNKVNLLIRILLVFNFILSFVLYFIPMNTYMVAVFFTLIISLTVTITPLLNSLAFAFNNFGYKINFGLARGMGSASYAIVSMVIGFVVMHYNENLLPLINGIINIAFMVAVKFYTIKDIDDITLKHEEKNQLSLREFVNKYTAFMILTATIVLTTFGHSLINMFFIQVIKNVGGNSSDMGTAIFIAAIVELPVMALVEKIIHKFKIGSLMKFSLFMFGVKHLLTYLAPNILVIYFAQFLQVFAFALYLPVGVYYVNKVIQKEDLIKGQSLLNMAATLGGVFASFIGGILLDKTGVSSTLLISSVLSFVGIVIAFRYIEN